LRRRQDKSSSLTVGKVLGALLSKEHLLVANALGSVPVTYQLLKHRLGLNDFLSCGFAALWYFGVPTTIREWVALYMFLQSIRTLYDVYASYLGKEEENADDDDDDDDDDSNNDEDEEEEEEEKSSKKKDHKKKSLFRVYFDKTKPYHEYVISGALFTTIGYALYQEPKLLDDSYYRSMLQWGDNTHEQMETMFRTFDSKGYVHI
ncbi:ATPase family AAA domain-containing protein 2, partial [Reticulomyxa filosa]